MAIQSYRDLDAYKHARNLIVPIHELIEKLPSTEKFGLCDQMRHASKSVVDNIVEGYSHKDTPAKMKSFWRISMGSANEKIEHLEQTALLKYAPIEIVQPMIDEYPLSPSSSTSLSKTGGEITARRSHSNIQLPTSTSNF
jgi:four helix bundle protein